MKSKTNSLTCFKFSELDVGFIYGFQTNLEPNQFEELKLKLEGKNKLRNGWVSFYPNQQHYNELIQIIDDNPTKHELQINNENIVGSKLPIRFKLYRDLTIRKDGAGSITVKLELEPGEYIVSDVLRILLLVPRTLYQNDEFQYDRFLDSPNSNGYSDIFQVFAEPLR